MGIQGCTLLPRSGLVFIISLTVIAVSDGCRAPRPGRPEPPTLTDRLMRAYPELQGGRFVVIADFERPEQMEIFQLISVSDEAECVLDPARGRTDTGAGCLRFTANSPGDTIVVNNTRAAHWSLRRDWRAFDLLLMSIQSPVAGLVLDITVAGGRPEERRAAAAALPLADGWMVGRLDLAQIAESVPMDDIREIRLAVSGASRPVQLLLDDIILTEHRMDLLGDASNRHGGLYVRRVGRRLKIGAGRPGSDFELTFSNGQIVEWYNIAADPYRLHNLVRGTTLGPMPVPVGPDSGNERGVSNAGEALAVRSRLVEMNAVRAVVSSEWRFVDDAEASGGNSGGRPVQRWTYTIYPSGQIYVSVEAASAARTWSVPRLGLAVALASPPSEELRTFVGGDGEGDEVARSPVYGTVRNTTNDALLLYVVHNGQEAMRISDAPATSGKAPIGADSVSLVAFGEKQGRNVEKWSCHMFVGSSSEVSDEEVLARAVAYARPVPPRVEQGSLVADGAGLSGAAGFDPGTGCYTIAPGPGGVRFVLDGSEQPYFSPRFRISSSADREAWVYVDHSIFDGVARDTGGDLLFQLPGAIRKPVLVEVLFAPAGRSGGP
jgi:hypothetical protein